MASTEIKVSLERLISARDVITLEANNFMESMGTITTLMTNLDSVWDGSSSDEFLAQFKKLDASFNAYKGVIDAQAEALTKAAGYYEDRETLITNETSKLSNADLFA